MPKGAPDGQHVLLFRICFDTTMPQGGIYLTDAARSFRTFITEGFDADWASKQREQQPPNRR